MMTISDLCFQLANTICWMGVLFSTLDAPWEQSLQQEIADEIASSERVSKFGFSFVVQEGALYLEEKTTSGVKLTQLG